MITIVEEGFFVFYGANKAIKTDICSKLWFNK